MRDSRTTARAAGARVAQRSGLLAREPLRDLARPALRTRLDDRLVRRIGEERRVRLVGERERLRLVARGPQCARDLELRARLIGRLAGRVQLQRLLGPPQRLGPPAEGV